MKIVDELFKGYALIKKTLLPFGFIKKGKNYLFSILIHKGDYELQVSISDNKISAILFDNEYNDEYSQIIFDKATGSFITSLKEDCKEILIDIRNHCFKKEYFNYPQSNRITDLIKNKYNVSPEFLWDKYPGFGVFRNKSNKKWFGIIMNISKNKIIGDSKNEIEVLNIKLDDEVDKYLKHKGIYPSYHMNKKNWVSIILDDTLSDDEVLDLIDLSINKSRSK